MDTFDISFDYTGTPFSATILKMESPGRDLYVFDMHQGIGEPFDKLRITYMHDDKIATTNIYEHTPETRSFISTVWQKIKEVYHGDTSFQKSVIY